jgi:large repetitive protein
MRAPLRAVVALATLISLVLPAATTFAAASISLSPNVGALASSTTVSGGGFAASTTVRILFGGDDGTQLGSESTDASGNLPGLSLTVPNLIGGTYQVFATDGTNTASANFSIPSSLTLSPSSGSPGTSVTVSGTGFLSGEAISVTWDQGGNQVTTATANGSGAFSASFIAPNGIGNHQVVASGQTSHFTLATTFTLTGAANVGGASLSINPVSGADRSQVNLNGTGFAANEQVNLAVDGNALISITSDGNGNFTTSITLPSLAAVQHTISATGASSGHSASVLFTVTNGREQGATSCTDGDSRPGNGSGDRNHCHTGPPGQGSDRHGHGKHGDNNQGDNNQGQDD